MGVILDYHCETCLYGFGAYMGIGMGYPLMYAEAVEDGKAGKLGKVMKDFFEKYPNGAINPKYVLAQCEDCGNHVCVNDYTMYISKPDHVAAENKGRWSVELPFEDIDYVSDFENYNVYKKYPHKCKKCGGNMRILTWKEIESGLYCPHCHLKLKGGEVGMWD